METLIILVVVPGPPFLLQLLLESILIVINFSLTVINHACLPTFLGGSSILPKRK